MGYSDLHTHSTFCDGRATPEEMVLSAIRLGLSKIGILVHSYVEADSDYTVCDGEEAFLLEMERLKEKYKGKIEVLRGVERDVISTRVRDDYDYVIGSVHYLVIDGVPYSLDVDKEHFTALARDFFGGDYLALAEAYYESTAALVRLPRLDIIGHFDIITKYNEGDCLFDTGCERYRQAWRAAIDRLLPLGVPFEINTGAISRGYKTVPYPSFEMIEYIRERGGRLVLSSDSHKPHQIAAHFDEYLKFATE